MASSLLVVFINCSAVGHRRGLGVLRVDGRPNSAQREKITNGTITAHEPANHNRYGYSFSVNGKSYSGWESPRKEEPHVGQQVTVFYDPIDPTKNALTDFTDLETDSLGPVPILLFGIGAVALFIRYRRRRAKPTQGTNENP
jgi:hypothetical protein